MKIIVRILLGFFLIVVGVVALVGINYEMNRELVDMTLQISDVEAPLELMVEQAIGYDAMRTEAVHHSLLHAEKGDFNEFEEFKRYYDEVGTKLDTLLKVDARALLEKSKRTQELKDEFNNYLQKLDEVNLKLVDLETQAFEAMKENNIGTAYSLIVGRNYEIYKTELRELYLNWSAVEKNVTSNLRENIIEEEERLNNYNLYFAGLIVLLATIISILISFSISKSIKKLTSDVEEITKGNLDIQLRKNNITEIQNLVDSLNRILASLKLAILRTGLAKGEFGLGEAIRAKKEAEEKYKELFENAVDAIFIADAETRQLVDCNKAAEKLMGYSREKILSMKADELHPTDRLKDTMSGFKKQTEGKIKIVFSEILTKDNKRIPVTISSAIVHIEDKDYLQGIFRNITKEKELFGRGEIAKKREETAKGREEIVGRRERTATGREEIVGRREKIKLGEGREGIALGREKVAGRREETAKGREEMIGKREEVSKGREEMMGRREVKTDGKEGIIKRLIKRRKEKNEKKR